LANGQNKSVLFIDTIISMTDFLVWLSETIGNHSRIYSAENIMRRVLRVVTGSSATTVRDRNKAVLFVNTIMGA
jgi:hypothetical protein